MIIVENLHKTFTRQSFGRLFGKPKKVHETRALQNISFSVAPGEALGILGESGSGKTTLGRILARLILPTTGKVLFEEVDISTFSEKELRTGFRKRVRMIFQHPDAALNPALRINNIFETVLKLHTKWSQDERDAKIKELLLDVGLSNSVLEKIPSELSGGQKRRISFALALCYRTRSVNR